MLNLHIVSKLQFSC